MSFVMILQSVLFGGSILWGGTIDRLEQNSFEILNERVTNRKNYLENEMIQRWSDLAAAETLINQKVSNMLEQNQAVYSALTAEEEWTSELLELISPDLLHLMRRNFVTGAFVVFNGDTGFLHLKVGRLPLTPVYIFGIQTQCQPHLIIRIL